MTKKDYKVLQSYFDLKKGTKIYERDVQFLLLDHRSLWETYAEKCGEPAYTRNYGHGFFDRPDKDKINRVFLEDLLNLGIIEKLEVKNDRRNNIQSN